MSDETKVEEKDEPVETSNAAPALKKPVLLGRKLGMLQHFKDDGSVHLRRQGSVGSGTTPGRVLKGLRMAAHQGADKVTVRNLEILRSDPARSLLVIAGAVPGGKNGIVMVRKA